MTRLVIVRHGNTFAADEPPRRIGRGTDLPLVAAGIAQARALGEHLAIRGFQFGQAFVSPMVRTMQTANHLLAAARQSPVEQATEWLVEIDHGPDEGKLETEVTARLGRQAIAAWDRHGVTPPGWIVEEQYRVAAWHALLDTPPPGDTLVVTSNGAARFLLVAAPRLRFGRGRSMKLRTCAYAELVRAKGDWRLAAWDRRPSDPS